MSANVTPPRVYQLISTSTPPAPPVPLRPNDNGYVRVTTSSDAIGCSINAELVACETSADTWPRRSDGRPFHTASVRADGDFHLVDADLGALAGRVALNPGTYAAEGWTIVSENDSISFTNDHTGHGMRVSVAGVQPF
jgi:hypothetical protein